MNNPAGMFIKKNIFLFLFLLFIFLVFKRWFGLGIISGGDLLPYFGLAIEDSRLCPYTWGHNLPAGGIGGVIAHLLWPHFVLAMPIFFLGKTFLFNWVVIQRVAYLYPLLVLLILSPAFLFRNLFQNNKFYFLSSFILMFNTYVLMIIGGGQILIALSYALTPLVLWLFIDLLKIRLPARRGLPVNNLKRLVLTGLVLAIQMMCDLRIAYITIIGVGLYWLVNLLFINKLTSFRAFRSLLCVLIVPGIIAAALHFYWILPVIMAKTTGLESLGEAYTTTEAVKYFSFADFSNSLSLLHPNWPENIFGKTYFMRPEFLLLPILAFSSLLFIAKNGYMARWLDGYKNKSSQKNDLAIQPSNNMTILFFTSLALIGAFLAKGSKPPFGEVYLWLFKYFPGMSMFRDPTKFYLLVALSYSILIPFSLEQIIRRLKKVSSIKYLVLSIFVIYWLFLIRPAWLGQLGGTFKAREVPQEYIVLRDFIHNQEEFFRTFWIPKRQRFGFFSNNHPAIEGSELPSEEELTVMGVKYVIIPFDSEGEIFLEDRKYDPKLRLALEKELDKVSWLKKITLPCFNDLNHCNKIAIYQTPSYKDHFWTERVGPLLLFKEEPGQGPTLAWRMVNPTKYLVQVQNARQPFELVFSETYDELWQAKIGEKIIPSKLIYNNLNSFPIEQTGDFEIVVEFAAQKYVYWGLVVSGITILFLLLFLIGKK